jgi:hypothetical protein
MRRGERGTDGTSNRQNRRVQKRQLATGTMRSGVHERHYVRT